MNLDLVGVVKTEQAADGSWLAYVHDAPELAVTGATEAAAVDRLLAEQGELVAVAVEVALGVFTPETVFELAGDS